MLTKEFIDQVINGTLGENDVLEYASHVKKGYNGNLQALVDDLFLLAHGALLYGRTEAVSDWEEIDRLNKAASVICERFGFDWMEGAPSRQGQKQEQIYDHYITSKSVEECSKVYLSLVDAGYIAKSTTLSQWLAVCGKGDGSEAAKIDWISDKKLLGIFVDTFWGNNNAKSLWAILPNCFTVQGADIEKTDSIKNMVSKRKSIGDNDRNGKIKKLDSITNGTYQISQDPKR